MAKHLSLSERALIERALALGKSFSEIAVSLDRSPSTIAREVKNHRVFVSRWRDDKNDCLSYHSCLKRNRPLSYERVFVAIASVRVLSHGEQETTIRNYLNK